LVIAVWSIGDYYAPILLKYYQFNSVPVKGLFI